MYEDKLKEIRNFCESNSDQALIDKYSRYFKGGFEGYGIDNDVFKAQQDQWIADWKDEMSLDDYLDLGERLAEVGKYEEISLAIVFVKSESSNFTENTFDRIGKWFSKGIDNWANVDVLCMLVLSSFLIDKVISFDKLKGWTNADSEWQRRCVPVTLNELVKHDLTPASTFPLLNPIMLDKSEYVQKGIGTLLRSLWKKYPDIVEDYMLKWKDSCGRLIIQYATEKMDKEYRKKFRRVR